MRVLGPRDHELPDHGSLHVQQAWPRPGLPEGTPRTKSRQALEVICGALGRKLMGFVSTRYRLVADTPAAVRAAEAFRPLFAREHRAG